jgi:ribosomal protein L24
MVISGKDRGLVGEVIAVYPDRNKVTGRGQHRQGIYAIPLP